jgi:hypothetical protein
VRTILGLQSKAFFNNLDQSQKPDEVHEEPQPEQTRSDPERDKLEAVGDHKNKCNLL